MQFNPDLQNRYAWHCGRSKKEENRRGALSLCTDRNSIGIELCSGNLKHRIACPGDEAYYFTEAVLKNAAVLVGSLMEAFDVDISHVVRHYDVTGKECPGVRGWFGSVEESSEWLKFKDRAVIEWDRLVEAERIPENEFSRMCDDEFSEYLTVQGFASGYTEKLIRLHRAHPNWVFKSCVTGLKWRDVIVRETADKVSLTRIDAYKRDSIIVDAGGWCNAKEAAVEYFMDPRNFLNEDGICMFEDLSYEPDTDWTRDVNKILNPMKLPENGFTADVFIGAGRDARISPVHLASRARQETGGGSDCINGSRYKGRVCGY